MRTKNANAITYYQWQDGNGNCLREGTGNVVKIENGACASSDQTAWWFPDDTGFANQGYADIVQTRGNVNGYKVFAFSSIESGDWYQWNIPT